MTMPCYKDGKSIMTLACYKSDNNDEYDNNNKDKVCLLLKI